MILLERLYVAFSAIFAFLLLAIIFNLLFLLVGDRKHISMWTYLKLYFNVFTAKTLARSYDEAEGLSKYYYDGQSRYFGYVIVGGNVYRFTAYEVATEIEIIDYRVSFFNEKRQQVCNFSLFKTRFERFTKEDVPLLSDKDADLEVFTTQYSALQRQSLRQSRIKKFV